MTGKSFWTPSLLLVLVVCFISAPQSYAESDADQTFGSFVLDTLDTAATADSIADKIRARSIEIRSQWGTEDAVTVDERQWYERQHKEDRSAKPGDGPPPWAPAHGYRRKFGAQEERDLGAYTHRRIQEGATGNELVVEVRRAVERVVRGESVDPDRRSAASADERRSEKNDQEHVGKNRDDGRDNATKHRPAKGKRDGKGNK